MRILRDDCPYLEIVEIFGFVLIVLVVWGWGGGGARLDVIFHDMR